MKGITALLRALEPGEQVTVTGIARDGIYLIARRLSIRVSTTKFIGGFYVTRVDESRTAVTKDTFKLATSVENAEAGKFIEIEDGGLELIPIDET